MTAKLYKGGLFQNSYFDKFLLNKTSRFEFGDFYGYWAIGEIALVVNAIQIDCHNIAWQLLTPRVLGWMIQLNPNIYFTEVTPESVQEEDSYDGE